MSKKDEPDAKPEPRPDPRSTLRKAFDTVERAVASRAEPLAQTGGFAQALGVYVSLNRGVRSVVGKATDGVLHLVHIPTTSDVSRLHQHLASVDGHLADLLNDRDALEAAIRAELREQDEGPEESTEG